MRLPSRILRPASIAVGAALLAGTALRFLRLSEVPPSLYCDEAFQGYEAYSLLLTGADSRGVAWPLFFDTFGIGWEEPLYIYLTMIPVWILGTTEIAPRIVAAAAGSAAIAAVAWLAARTAGPLAAAVAALTMAFSPWAFHLSRVGFQASLLPLFLAAGAAALMQAMPGGSQEEGSRPAVPRVAWLVAGGAGLATCLYTYVAARGIVPLLLAGFILLHLRELGRLSRRAKLLAASAILLPALPIALFALGPQGLERFQDVGLAGRIPGGEAAVRFVGNYAGYFSPSFLLTDGDPNPRHSAHGFGMLHAHDLALATLGLLAALVRRRPGDLLLVWWLAVAPLGAAMTADPRHSVRSIAAMPVLHVLAGHGAAAIFGRGMSLDPRRRAAGLAVAALLVAGATLSIGVYMESYFVEYPARSAPAWQFGLRQAYERIEELRPGHDAVYVTRAEDYPWIHRLYLFAFPPERFQRSRFEGTGYLFDEPVFYRGGRLPGRRSPIFLLRPHELEASGLQPREVIPNPDGSPAFVLAW